MPDRAYIASILQRIEAALIAEDGPATLQVAKELSSLGKSATARSNRTNKKKTAGKARNEWQESTGVDPVKLFAFATLLHDTATDGRRKWRVSVECALMVLRPELSHRRGLFRPGVVVPPKYRPSSDTLTRQNLDQKRNEVIRKLGSAMNYKEGPLAPLFAEKARQWRACLTNRPKSNLAATIANQIN